MGYEMSTELIEGYAQIILHSKVDSRCPGWGTYTKNMKEVQTNLMDKEIMKKVGKVIDSILKELGMSRKEFEEVKEIALDMKARIQIELLTPTLIVMVGPTKEVIVS